MIRSLQILFAGIGVAAVCACSSIPDFKPSRPVEEASSFDDALNLCGEYKIDGRKSSAGMPMAERVVALVPWMRCFETVLRKVPEARYHQEFVFLFRALQARHDATPSPDAEVVDWPTMNFAVQHTLMHLHEEKNDQPGTPYNAEERQAIERQLPSLAMYLAESGRFASPSSTATSNTEVSDPEVRQWIAEERAVAARARLRKGRKPKLNQAQRDYCDEYLNYRSTISNLDELGRYQTKLEGKDSAKVDERFDALKKEALQERAKLQTMSAGVMNEACLK